MSSESGYIDGIYNYCDRWCERCPFTAQCRNFAMGEEFERAEREGRDPKDIDWEAFWESVGLSFDNTPSEWLGEYGDEEDGPEYDLGITFTESEGDDWETDDWLEEREEDKHPLVARAHDYCKRAHQWLREHARGWADESTVDPPASAIVDESDLKVQDAIAVVTWYHTMIPAKVTRAISGLLEDPWEDEPWSESLRGDEGDADEDDVLAIMREAKNSDAAGSAKVALISIERSIGAWTALRTARPDLAESIAPLQRLLGWLRVTIDRLLPDARTFHRPGFDDPSEPDAK